MKIKRPSNVDNALNFFLLFARIEYALKETGFCNRNGDAKPDWSKYAKHVDYLFCSPTTNEFKEAISYYLANPPKKQIVRDYKLFWDDLTDKSGFLADKILIYIRCVRNNLFHGGKFIDGFYDQSSRNEELIRYGLIILETCITNTNEIKSFFDRE